MCKFLTTTVLSCSRQIYDPTTPDFGQKTCYCPQPVEGYTPADVELCPSAILRGRTTCTDWSQLSVPGEAGKVCRDHLEMRDLGGSEEDQRHVNDLLSEAFWREYNGLEGPVVRARGQ